MITLVDYIRSRFRLLFLLTIFVLIWNIFVFVPEVDSFEALMAPFEKTAQSSFSQNIRPNVLLLLDTSGSMTYQMDSNSHTRGDGSRPYDGHYYFGKDTDNENNDDTEEYTYHPNLTYILNDDLPHYGYLPYYFVTGSNSPGGEYSNYLYPNDSRLYNLKMVLWHILEDPNLVKGLNMGLATYRQRYVSSGSDFSRSSNFYCWRPYSSTDDGSWLQEITYDYNDSSSNNYNSAMFREPFGSTDDETHRQNILKWVDGEQTGNDELRAHGNTPLANSLYDSGSDYDSAKDFFFDEGPIEHWCQDNWVIVLTDGQETAGGNPVSAVENLYNYGENHWTDPITSDPPQPVRTLVIGMISSDDMSTSLVNELNTMADIGWDGVTDDIGPKGEGVEEQAFFANDVPSLLKAFRDIFTIIQTTSGTGGAPLISPARLEGQSTSVYVSTYLPQEQNQWQGDLFRYVLSGDIIPEDPEWSAAQNLNNTHYSTRNVYTVDWSSDYADTPISGSNFASFSASQAEALRPEMCWGPQIWPWNQNRSEPSISALGKFINWVLGNNEYGGLTGQRWKLGDIFHSGITEVGTPLGTNPHSGYRTFRVNNSNRDKLVYVQANDGMIHAFNVEDAEGGITGGDERWAFIPPNVLGTARLVGLRSYFNWLPHFQVWRVMENEVNDNTSRPRYLLDGPLVAEDVYFQLDEDSYEWRTILMGLLGYAGAGMYCLDITDPDTPSFLWAVENAIYKPDLNNTVYNWSGYRTVTHWVQFGDVVVREDFQHNGTVPSTLDYRDLRFTLSVPAIGSLKYSGQDYWVAVMGSGSSRAGFEDPIQDGSVYIIDITDGTLVVSLNPSGMKQVVTPITVKRTNNAQRIEEFYAGDNAGHVYKWEVDDNWTGQEVLFISADVGTSYRMDLAEIQNDTWLFVVTGDYDPLVQNEGNNYFVAVNTNSSEYPIELAALENLVDSDDVPANDQGWYFQFDTSVEELATTPPLIYNGYIFFSTFVSDVDPCKAGKSRMYVVNAQTGASGWGSGEDRFIELEGVRISGITLTGDKVFVGITNFTNIEEDDLPDVFENQELNASIQGNILVFDVPDAVANNPFPIPSGSMVPRYWREWRP